MEVLKIKNKNIPSVYGKGIIGEGLYSCSSTPKIYERWRSMLKRCYNNKSLNRYPTYLDCTVCEEWLNLQNFGEWYDKNYYTVEDEVMCLDKDILIKGNKIYNPNTCIFVPQRINLLFTKKEKSRGEYPIGVHKEKKNYVSMCNVYKNNKYISIRIGWHNSVKEAFDTYKIFKENYIKQEADYYKSRIPNKLYEAMYNWVVEITD